MNKTKSKSKPKPSSKRRAAASKSGNTIEIHVLNGPNLNMLGFREPHIYGHETLPDLEQKLVDAAKELKARIKLRFFQTNYEGEMIDYIHALALGIKADGKDKVKTRLAGVILNPSEWTHTSIALRDAVLMLQPVPIVEVHLINPLEREPFRHHSFFEDIVDYRILGMGQDGYLEALRWLTAEMKKERLDIH